MGVRRHSRGWVLTALLVIGGEEAAQTPERAVIEQLARQGYVDFEVSRTLLGRIRVVALSPDGSRRDIVFNPATGEILRDYVEAADGRPARMVLNRTADHTDTRRLRAASERADQSAGSQDIPDASSSRIEDSRPRRSAGPEAGRRETGQTRGAERDTAP